MDSSSSGARPSNFIRDLIDEDLQSGRYGEVVTRFPPEPNGYLHIGHAKAICVDFGLAEEFGGRCHLRFDDTNPEAEDIEYALSIQNDVRWLGFDWKDHLYYASDYYEQFYQYAEALIEKGLAYVDSSTEEEIRQNRGSLGVPGQPGKYRSRSVSENLDLLRSMRAGQFKDGDHVLRAKIDLAASNMKMRDPLLYRIRHAHHYRTGDAWCIYPMYDFAHPLSDAIEGVTHSICTLEFENNRELYDWVIEACETEARPRQIEFARLALGYTVMSKRKLLKLVDNEVVSGWDDPRMPTIAGLRRRGVTPEAIRSFCELIGVAKANSMVDLGKLNYAIRDDLNFRAPRVMCVIDPLPVVIAGLESTELDAPSFPADVGKPGSRQVPLTERAVIERADFMRDPEPGFRRLTPGGTVRLRYAGIIRCDEVIEGPDGQVAELRCTAVADSEATGKVGVIHWVSAERGLPCQVDLYEQLFAVEKPDEAENPFDHIDPASHLVKSDCLIEPSVADSAVGSHFQFERHGYFVLERKDGDRPVFNRVVALRDSRPGKATESARPATAKRKNPKAQTRPKSRSKAEVRDKARSMSPELVTKLERFTGELGLDRKDAEVLTGDLDLAAFYEAVVAAGASPAAAANWVLNEFLGRLGEGQIDSLDFSGGDFGRLVALVEGGTISSAGGKQVLDAMLEDGGDPAELVAQMGLAQVSDSSSLEPLIEQVLADNPEKVERYRSGKTGLLGFFVGQVMKASGGAANPQSVGDLLKKRLAN